MVLGTLSWLWHGWKRCASERYSLSCKSMRDVMLSCIIKLSRNMRGPSMTKRTQNKPQRSEVIFSVLLSIVVRPSYDVMKYDVTVLRPGCGRSNVHFREK